MLKFLRELNFFGSFMHNLAFLLACQDIIASFLEFKTTSEDFRKEPFVLWRSNRHGAWTAIENKRQFQKKLQKGVVVTKSVDAELDRLFATCDAYAETPEFPGEIELSVLRNIAKEALSALLRFQNDTLS